MTMKPWKTPLPDEPAEYTLRCTHQKLWPPPLVKLGVDIRAMWRSGEIEQHDYQQVETWEKICGLVEMGEKCLSCPLAKVELPVPGEGQSKVNVEPLDAWIKRRSALRSKASLIRRKAAQAPTPAAPEPEKPSPSPAPDVDPETGEVLDLDKLLD
jgi:hypothetical protein